MNSYIDAQCRFMLTSVDTFVTACELAAKKDDGKISREEERILHAIRKASEKYKSKISKIIREP